MINNALGSPVSNWGMSYREFAITNVSISDYVDVPEPLTSLLRGTGLAFAGIGFLRKRIKIYFFFN